MGNSSVFRTAFSNLHHLGTDCSPCWRDWENSPLQGNVRASGWKPIGSMMLTAGWCVMCTMVFKLCRAEEIAGMVACPCSPGTEEAEIGSTL